MKNKILIFALCFTLLLGVFSVSAFADNSVYATDTFVFDDIVYFSAMSHSVSFTSNGFTFTSIEFSITNVTNYLRINYRQNGGIPVTVYDSSKNGWIDVGYKTIKLTDNSTFASYFTTEICETFDTFGTFIESHDHSYSSTVIAPTHTDQGYTLYTCSCGDTYKDNYVNALGHDYTIVTQPSTCTVKGSSTYTCSCGHSYTEELALLPHNYTVDVKPSTCTVKGYKVSTCTCGHVLRETLDLLPHSYSVLTKESTCSVPGSNTYTCSCGHSYSEKLPKLDHTFVEGRCSVCNALDPLLYKDSEDNILNAWREVYTDFFGLFGSAQSIFYDGSNLTLIGGLAIIGLVLVLGFLLFLVIEKFIHFRW